MTSLYLFCSPRHSFATSPSDAPRTSFVARYCPCGCLQNSHEDTLASMAATMCVCQDLPTTPCRGKRSCCSDAMLKTNLMGSTSKSTYSMRNRGVGGLGDPAGWKSKRNNLNEEVKEGDPRSLNGLRRLERNLVEGARDRLRTANQKRQHERLWDASK